MVYRIGAGELQVMLELLRARDTAATLGIKFEAEIVLNSLAETISGSARMADLLDKKMHQLEAAEAKIALLRAAITPTHATDPAWSVQDVASLAIAHRHDSESVDARETEQP